MHWGSPPLWHQATPHQLDREAWPELFLTPAGRLPGQLGQDVFDLLDITEMEILVLREGAAGTYRIAAFPSAPQPELGLTVHL